MSTMELVTPSQALEDMARHIATAHKPLLVIVGPTAAGKTALSLQAARMLGGECINADSCQLYTGLSIGTAKVTESERSEVPHHLLDVLDPREQCSIAKYKEMATAVIDDCHARNVVPILVGGSMLYVSAVVDGLEPLPPPDPAIRARLESAWDADDGWTLYEKLLSIDPATASAFEHQNKVYVVRAMELYEMTGIPPSRLKKTVPPPYGIHITGVWWERERLTERIDARVAAMLQNGWIEEVEGLLDRGYSPQDPAMRSHGYREIIQWLSSEERDEAALASVIAAKTRAYAKRQMTWWSKDDRIQWTDGAAVSAELSGI